MNECHTCSPCVCALIFSISIIPKPCASGFSSALYRSKQTYQQLSFLTLAMSDTLVRATIISSVNLTMMPAGRPNQRVSPETQPQNPQNNNYKLLSTLHCSADFPWNANKHLFVNVFFSPEGQLSCET